MAQVFYTRPAPFAAGAVRTALSDALPAYTWTIGDQDDGRPASLIDVKREQLAVGRADEDAIFIAFSPIERPDEPFAAGYEVDAPRGEDQSKLDTAFAQMLAALGDVEGRAAKIRLTLDGDLVDAAGMRAIAALVRDGTPFDDAVAQVQGTLPSRPAATGGLPAEDMMTPTLPDPAMPPAPDMAERDDADGHADAPRVKPAQDRWPDVPRKPGGFGRKR